MRPLSTVLSAMLLRTFCTATCFWALAIGAADAQQTSQPAVIKTPATEDGKIDSVVGRGQKLENERRWGEAVTLYEEALRTNPTDHDLATRHEIAKIHYDLGRRYHDSSFLRSLGSLDQRETLALYGEVLSKIQSHYVVEPDWTALVRRGTAGLEVALGEAAFVRQTGLTATRPEIDAFREQLVRQMQNQPIRDRQQAIDAVTQAVQLARLHLHLPAAPVILEFACGAAGSLDEYSAYLTGDQLNDVYSQIEGNFVGLGIELKAQDSTLLIVKVITGSPAERAGLKAQDRIVAVGSRSTTDLSTDQAADLLQGAEGSLVELTIQTSGSAARKLVVRRQHVEVPSIDDVKIVDREKGIGYLKLTCFQKTTSRDLDAALWRLQSQGMRSLIMDLRGNPGGLLTSSVEVADKFVYDGVIVSTHGRSSLEDYNYTAHKAGTWDVPLVVLIDGDSASASEIFAGAIRDHKRGTIIGQRSYGKGSVQGIFPLAAAGAGVRLTTAKFYSPSGAAISKVGVSPDIAVVRTAKPVDGATTARSDQDDVMVAALKHLRLGTRRETFAGKSQVLAK
ncbi:MAG TPA: S41 family peptidase [Pirellulales bacterium]|jgi:carboxyl-terminal processing protease|nr:S41 family peptidase [Pirellulales bacterium]